MNCPNCNTPLENGICPNCSKTESLNVVESPVAENLVVPEVQNNESVEQFDTIESGDKLNVPTEEVTIEQPTEATNEEKTLVVSNDNKSKKKLMIKIDKDAKMPTVLAILFIVVFFFVGLLFGKVFFSKTVISRSNSAVSTINKDSLKANGKTNTTYIDGVTYQIPTKYLYDKTLSGVLIYDPDDKFRIYVRKENGSFEVLSTSVPSIRATLNNANFRVSNIKEMDIKDKKSLIIEGTTNLTNRLVSFIEAAKDQLFYIEVVTSDNQFNYDVLGLAIEILKTTKIEKTTSEMEKIAVEDIAKLVVTAANAANSIRN